MSLPRMRAEESLRPEATYGQMSQMSQLGGGISSATVAGSEAQKVRIQSTIDLQLDKVIQRRIPARNPCRDGARWSVNFLHSWH